MNLNKSPIFLVFLFLVTGCYNKTYRTEHAARCEELTEYDCENDYLLVTKKQGNDQNSDKIKKVSLSFFEFDDQGQYRNRNLHQKSLEYIRKRGADNGQVIMVFIHGWHNNARSRNAEEFWTFLKDVSKVLNPDGTTNNPIPVTGVYIGWRGKSLPSFFNYLTFWDRKSVSDDVGNGAIVDVLTELEKISKENRADEIRKKGGKFNTRLITIGHSLGASVLLSATKNILHHNEISDKSGYGDMVILVNPAKEAESFLQLRELGEDRYRYTGNKEIDIPIPRLLVLTSESDWVTKYTFFIGRLFSTFLEKHNKYTMTDRKGNTESHSEYWLDNKSVGHYTKFITHRLETNGDYDDAGKCQIDIRQKWIYNLNKKYKETFNESRKSIDEDVKLLREINKLDKVKDLNKKLKTEDIEDIIEIIDTREFKKVKELLKANDIKSITRRPALPDKVEKIDKIIKSDEMNSLAGLIRKQKPKRIEEPKKIESIIDNAAHVRSEGWKFNFDAARVTLEHKENSSAENPFWDVYVDNDIIPGHNDIFTPQVACFIKEVITVLN